MQTIHALPITHTQSKNKLGINSAIKQQHTKVSVPVLQCYRNSHKPGCIQIKHLVGRKNSLNKNIIKVLVYGFKEQVHGYVS